MNHRQRFHATMRFEERDRLPIIDWGYWPETVERWLKEGLPQGIGNLEHDTPAAAYIYQYFGLDYDYRMVTWTTGTGGGLTPPFEEKVMEDRGETEVVQQPDGVRVLRHKTMSSIPKHLGHLLEDRDSWEKHYKPRLDPNSPGRYLQDMQDRLPVWRDPNRDWLLVPWVGGLYGPLRDWMGLEKVSMVVYDDPAWFGEMVNTMGDCIYGILETLLNTGAQLDACALWEDMCYNRGPLLHPKHVRKYMLPQYKRICGLLNQHGVDTIWLDSDGRIDKLIPIWLEAGINCMMPIEIGTTGMDPIELRREFGRDLRMMGGFDKRILAGTKDDIRREVDRLAPLVEEGGFIPFCDHLVPPDVPLENYETYLDCVRNVWGQGLNLQPRQLGMIPGSEQDIGKGNV
jgi:hypothetical protein